MPRNNVIHLHAINFFNHTTISPKSWVNQICDLCLQYALPHPADILSTPFSKYSYKSLTRKRVVDYSKQKLRQEANQLSSLKYFYPQYMSLTSTHPKWVTSGSSPTKVQAMASVQVVLVSGRFRTEATKAKVKGSTKNVVRFLVLVRGNFFLYHLKDYLCSFILNHDSTFLGAPFMA